MRAFYGNGLIYYSKPLSPAEIQRAVFRNEASEIRAGRLGGTASRHACGPCGADLRIIGANRSGTIWRKCDACQTDDYEPTTKTYPN